jgi:hypothetical protein
MLDITNTVLLICIAALLLGLWILWRVVSIDPQPQENAEPKEVRAAATREQFEAGRLTFEVRDRGIVLPKEFVGPTYRNTRHSGPHFWTEEEP